MVISSKDNELVKHIKKLKDKKYRDEFSEFIIEGSKIVEEATQERAKIKKIIVSESYEKNKIEYTRFEGTECVVASDKIFKDISGVVNGQGIMAIIQKDSLDEENLSYDEDFYLILDDIQDPGNLGTIIRTADSLNIKQIIVSKGTADNYNPKVVRSTMGAIFRVKIIETDDLVKTIELLKKHNIKVYATDLQTEDSIYTVDFEKSAVVIGNEANGVEDRIKEVSDKRIKIPMPGKTESLNAAVATSIVLYEAFRTKLK